MGQILTTSAMLLLGQRGHLFPWAPVFLALGIGCYFSLRVEPPIWALGLMAAGGIIALRQVQFGAVFGPLVAALGLFAFGFALAGARTHLVAGPVLDFRYYGAIEGRIVNIDRSSSDAVRLTLDQVVLERMSPQDTPQRVRVSLHGEQGFAAPEPGAVVILTGHLSPPGGAVEPGGFDFRRHAWFLRLGAVGYTRTPLLLMEKPGSGMWLFKARVWLSARVQATLPGETGAFAAAIMAGERSGMEKDTLQALRDTNLAHLIAISGLHMGLLAGFVFTALRFGLLLVPATRHAGGLRKVAALGALLAAAGYLALSGGSIATQRAFIMAAAGLIALMLDRRVLSLRSVAIAALIVLSLRPEALLSPGFQMSFAATTALVAVFEQISRRNPSKLPRWVGAVLSVVVSSAVAGAATAPVGMAHFNQIASYGLLANVISVPVMGLVVVPAGVCAALLMPLGLDWIALWVMGLGLDWILFVAHHIGAWDGAVRPIHAPSPWVLPVFAIGGLILCIWRGAGRLAGIAPILIAVAGWAATERPGVLIADTGTLLGVMTAEGRALSREKGAGFVARTWLENDGLGDDQALAGTRWPHAVEARLAEAEYAGLHLVHLQGKRAARAWADCAQGQIIVSSVALDLQGPCLVLDPSTLRTTGSVAVYADQAGVRIVTDTDLSGQRPWHPVRKARDLEIATLWP